MPTRKSPHWPTGSTSTWSRSKAGEYRIASHEPGIGSEGRKRALILVAGDVQGVGFRFHTHATARALGVCGFVRNLADGSVHITAEGNGGAIERLIEWAHRGPPSARVDRVTVQYAEPTGEFPDFAVRH
jgi:acylphosphatase